MKLYNADTTVTIEDVPITSSAVYVQELMKSDYVHLAWSDVTYYVLKTGTYIEYNGIQYTLLEDVKPTSKNELEYVYEANFQHPFYKLAHTPCLFKTKNASGDDIYETDWQYVGNLGTILSRLQTIINEQSGYSVAFTIVGDVQASATCSFASNDIISALNHIAQTFGVEWHYDWSTMTIYVGENLSLNDSQTLEEGVNVRVAQVNKGNTDNANVYVVRGGTRNITMQTESGDNVATDTRLSLDGYTDTDGNTYGSESAIDMRTDKANEPKLTKFLVFDNVYPHLDLYVYDVRTHTRRLLDDKTNQPIPASYGTDGEPTSYKMYSVYYFRLAYYNEATGLWRDYLIEPTEDIISGKELTASFEPNEEGTHSALAGREFKLTYHKFAQTILPIVGSDDTGIEIKAGDYEINFVREGDFIIPNHDTLAPYGESTPSLQCDKVVLFNVVMSDEYIANAQAELYAEAKAEITRLRSDLNNYIVSSNKVTYNLSLNVADKVHYKAISGYELDTRVIKIEQRLDTPTDVKITIGNAEVKGSIQTLKEEVAVTSSEISATQAMNEAVSAMTATITNAQNSLKEAMAQWQGMWQFDEDGNVFSKYNVYSKGDISAFGYVDTELPSADVTIEQILTSGTEIARINGMSIYAPVGGGTQSYSSLNIYKNGELWSTYNPTTGDKAIYVVDSYTKEESDNKYALKGDVGGLDESSVKNLINDTYISNLGFTTTSYVDDKITALNISQYATDTDLSTAVGNMEATAHGYANSALADAKSYAEAQAESALASALAYTNTQLESYVTLETPQEISGQKTFLGKTIFGSSDARVELTNVIALRNSSASYIDLYAGDDYSDSTDYPARLIAYSGEPTVLCLESGRDNIGTLKIGNAYITYDAQNNALMVSDGSGGAVNLVATGDVTAYSGLGSGFDTLTDLTLTNKLKAKYIQATSSLTAGSATIGGVKFYEDDDYCPVIDLSGDGENLGYITGADAFIMDRALVKRLQLYDSIEGNYKDIKYDGDNDYVYITINGVKYKFVMEKV